MGRRAVGLPRLTPTLCAAGERRSATANSTAPASRPFLCVQTTSVSMSSERPTNGLQRTIRQGRLHLSRSLRDTDAWLHGNRSRENTVCNLVCARGGVCGGGACVGSGRRATCITYTLKVYSILFYSILLFVKTSQSLSRQFLASHPESHTCPERIRVTRHMPNMSRSRVHT